MAILEKAKELADLITESPELAAVRDAEEQMLNDSAAFAVIQDFQQKQTIIQQAYMKGEELNDAQKMEIEQLQEKMRDNPLISRYIEAQERFDQILHAINHLITKAITGEEGEGCGCNHVQSDCSSCESCS